MAASTLAVAGIVVLGLLFATGVVGWVLFIPLVVLATLPLGLALLGKLFSNTQPTVDPATGPATPSTAQASYDPVTDPSERGV